MNRLQLNFQLESAEDRAAFVQDYLQTITFVPNEYELETIGNYILWGKDHNGKNSQQNGGIKLKEWATTNVESLEGLMELPGFQETSLRSITEPPARIPRVVFNRKTAYESAPDYIKDIYSSLWRQIDEIELILNFYELWSGKRKNPPRDQLINRFTEEEQIKLNEKALRLTQYKYLKMRHLLVDLRSQQYLYADAHTDKIQSHSQSEVPVLQSETIYIGEDITVLPLGLINDQPITKKLFNWEHNPAPDNFSEEELKYISGLIWTVPTKLTIDFTDEEHVLNLYKLRADLMEAQDRDPAQIYGSAASIVETLKFYEYKANLSDLQKSILEQKLKKIPNANIADNINQTYNKSYNDNYISTIFHQKIIPMVANAARTHADIAQNLFYPENFKKCKDCGEILLLNTDNFVKQKKSSDGFSPRCKRCEKIKRSKYK